jgi:hypothetical protein
LRICIFQGNEVRSRPDAGNSDLAALQRRNNDVSTLAKTLRAVQLKKSMPGIARDARWIEECRAFGATN